MCLQGKQFPKWIAWAFKAIGWLQCGLCPHKKECQFRR